ncbi:MAG: endolytic transglycosylase MltG [Methyloceanibacter sp.]|nr:endolytic transglycosylase MltG [Methyloceanibacter sp.]
MSLTRDLPSTANDNDERIPAGAAGRQLAVLPGSPAEALEPTRPPEPPERDEPEPDPHPFLRMLDGLVTFVFLLACLFVGVFYWVKVQFDQPGPLATSTVVVIPKGDGVSAIAERLERDGVIADRRIFMTSILYFMYLKGQGSLKAGEYEFRKYATMRSVLDTLVEGKSIEHKVTLAEGLTSFQIVEKLRAHPELHGEVTEIPAEGSLLPDTYRFGRNDTRQDIVERMQAAQAKFLGKVWATRDEHIVVTTPEEALILASIVEKETGRADERARIASVFQNRIRKNMRLQSDPTIIYGLVGGKGALDGPLMQQDLDRETAYNTYQINGLPPTPIANPGRAAIEAVLRPAKTKDLYFVADGTGGHVFAPTLDEHNKNVFRWRKIEREIRAREAQEAAAKAAQDAAGVDSAETATEPAPLAPPVTPQDGAMAADPADISGAFADPTVLLNPEQDPFAVPPEAASGEAVPKPLRNPKR